jgi:hypothetical protein
MVKKIKCDRMKRLYIVLAIIGFFAVVIYFAIYNKSIPFIQTSTKPPNAIAQLPVYPGASLQHSSTIPDKTVQGVGERYQAVWKSSAGIPEISAWYQKKLVDLGWTIDVPPVDTNQPIQLITFTRDVRIIDLSLVAGTDPTTSEITLDYIPGLMTENDEK